ncbi:MAG: Peptidase family [Sediminibacterium sp.]|nr:Peptidase family [Sediminibacterium sp.]
MRHQNLLRFLLLLTAAPCFGQNKLITCKSEKNPDNTISIYADCQVTGEYTAKLTFIDLEGFNSTVNIISNVALIPVRRGYTEILKLTPMKSAVRHAMHFKYAIYPGPVLHRSPDTSFTYLLPASNGVSLRILKVSSLQEFTGKKPPDDFGAVDFIYKAGDTICAARAGIVYDFNDEITVGEKDNNLYAKERNRIFIQHKDGTLAHYTMLAPIQILVNSGDEVIPGQPLAVFNKESDKYHVLFSVAYLDERKAAVNYINDNTPKPSFYRYVPVTFATTEITTDHLEPGKKYTAEQPKEIIGAEMSKKDKKKLGL